MALPIAAMKVDVLFDPIGTDDDLPPSHQNRNARGGLVSRNGRPVVGGHAYPRVQNDMERQIHQLEQEAYSSVLRAFKAQSDAITWEKEGLITELRKELRLSDDEHRDLLSRVNADEIIRGIREWRQSGGLQSGFLSNVQPNHDIIPSPSVSASRKRQKTSQIIPPLPLGVPSPSLHSQPIGVPMQSSSAAKRGAPGVRGKKPKLGQALPAGYTPTGPSGRGQTVNRSLGAITTAHSVEAAQYDPLIGRKVMTRWPDDNNFYEAVISDYDAMKGLHLLTYDINTPNETWEWVNLEEISAEDIRWEGEDPFTNRSGRGGIGRGFKKSRGGTTPAAGRGRGFLKNQPRKDFPPTQNGVKKKNLDEIEILNTETLIKEVEMIFDATHLDPLEFEKAKKVLKEHEQSLLDAIARLADASDGESDDDHHLSNGQSMDVDRNWRNQQFNGNQPKTNYENEMAVVGRDSFGGERMIAEG
ncbi:protein EMSY-LIKE 3 isoform X2 [Dendrobium catenatum]|uniref:protein EMSY-LIKE 3 isoform X2 n=1 Tax=Dendrobium catenatum TaxID=906689 RepID=UPI0010A04095|nr:protein EMSY-LIKE 3 isoform X2 [Dendrobium catenatum]